MLGMGEAHAAEGGMAVRKVECIGDVGDSPPACRNIPTFPDKQGIWMLACRMSEMERILRPLCPRLRSYRIAICLLHSSHWQQRTCIRFVMNFL
jgi:hypothetical protein